MKIPGEWQEKSVKQGWVSLCECPSCPVRFEAERIRRENG